MRKIHCFIVGLLLISKPLFAQDKVLIRADSWCPFTCEVNGKSGQGILVDILKEALGKDKIQIDYQTMNWPRAIDQAQKGQIHGILGAYKEDAPDFIFPDQPQFVSRDCFYQVKGSTWKYSGIESLRGKKVGVAQGYSYGENFDNLKNKKENKKIFAEASGNDPLFQNLKKTHAKRLDIFMENKAVIAYYKKIDSQFSDVEEAGCLEEKAIYAAFSPAKKDESLRLKNAVDQFMKDKKAVEAVYKKYLN